MYVFVNVGKDIYFKLIIDFIFYSYVKNGWVKLGIVVCDVEWCN